jgi:hypothetical protein
VERLDRALVLDPDAQQLELADVLARADELADAAFPAGERRGERRLLLSRAQQLGAVRPGVGDAADADEPPRLGDRPSRDARHAGVAAPEAAQQQRDLVAHVGVLRAADDRRERAVDVAEDRRPLGVVCQRAEALAQRLCRGRGHST